MENNKSTLVYKFGGASVKDAEGMKRVGEIVARSNADQLAVVVSAMGKTTNELEQVINYYYKQETEEAFKQLDEIKASHYEVIKALGLYHEEVITDINDTFVEIEWILEDELSDGYDYLYDQIVSVGELISTKILHHYLRSLNQSVSWLDARDIILTDNSYREAKVDWTVTQERINRNLIPLWDNQKIIITQGFIGSSSENFTTTLGREGSDYTGSILTYCVDAESLTIWKDVPGILTGDPKIFDNVTLIRRLDYREAIEMTYFGAKVIHPKTIKPLQNKTIPLHVKSFISPENSGTIIMSDVDVDMTYPPVVVLAANQTLLNISTKDFSFVAEEHLSEIFTLLNKYRLKVNMMRNSAISFAVSVTHDDEKIKNFEEELDSYNVIKDEDLNLITIRHFDENTIERLTKDKIVIFEERLNNTMRAVVKNTPSIKFK